MNTGKAFLSYAHSDNEAEKGRIHQIAKDIVNEYKLITAEDIDLFIDSANINPGDDWKAEIDKNLLQTRYFMPIITPSYFKSAACRNEFNYFYSKAKEIGKTQLIIPIYYIHTDELNENTRDDEIGQIVSNIQWVDMRELRFEETSSPAYRKEINKVALKIRQVNEELLDSTDIPDTSESTETSGEDGIVDSLYLTETNAPKLEGKLTTLASLIQEIGETARKYTPKNQNTTFAQKITLLKNMSSEMKPKADRLQQESKEYLEILHSIDPGIRIIINQAMKIESTTEREKAKEDFIIPLLKLASASESSLNQVESATTVFSEAGNISREIRPITNSIAESFILIKEGNLIINNWKSLIES